MFKGPEFWKRGRSEQDQLSHLVRELLCICQCRPAAEAVGDNHSTPHPQSLQPLLNLSGLGAGSRLKAGPAAAAVPGPIDRDAATNVGEFSEGPARQS